MSRATYGERMSAWERRQDELYWKKSFERAQAEENYKEVEDLLKEALHDDYEIPTIRDLRTIEILKRLKQT